MGTKFVIRLVIVALVNAFVFYLANIYYPQNVVLGNANLTKEMAALVSGFLLALLCRIPKPLIVAFGVKKVQGRFAMFVFYFLFNSAAIWLLARIAPISGLGITAFYWAFGMGFVVALLQWLTRQIFKATNLLARK